jgi:hypothetical protein
MFNRRKRCIGFGWVRRLGVAQTERLKLAGRFSIPFLTFEISKCTGKERALNHTKKKE